MENRLDRIESKVDQIIQQQSDHNAILSVNTNSLQEHMRRSDALEAIVIPMKKKWDMAEGALKLVGAIASLLGLLAGIISLIEALIK